MASETSFSGPFRSPPGTRDILPPESAAWQVLLTRFSDLARLAGYGLAMTPIFEEVGVFSRGVGTSTDIVAKEMYEFTDKGGRQVALRPEATASMVRAFIENRPATLPWKAWYWGPMFRYERPQAGRYRQFYQLGAEVIGTEDPEADVEIVALAWDFFEKIGIARKTLKINSLGCGECRPTYRKALLAYLTEYVGGLCSEHRERYGENPMRILDCKKPECQAVSDSAPRQMLSLCDACSVAIVRVTSGLQDLSIPFVTDQRLVRGLDYYTRTTFEIAGDGLDAAQNAIGGGGRYDGLVAGLGGPPTPAVGFSAGIERVILARMAEGGAVPVAPAPDVFIVDIAGPPAAGRQATLLSHELRECDIAAGRDFGDRSAKSQFKAADRSGASVALVIGPDEVAADTVTLKPLRVDGEQRQIARSRIVEELKAMLA